MFLERTIRGTTKGENNWHKLDSFLVVMVKEVFSEQEPRKWQEMCKMIAFQYIVFTLRFMTVLSLQNLTWASFGDDEINQAFSSFYNFLQLYIENARYRK